MSLWCDCASVRDGYIVRCHHHARSKVNLTSNRDTLHPHSLCVTRVRKMQNML
jgi:hypothetical protein